MGPSGREPVSVSRYHYVHNPYHFVASRATLHSDRNPPPKIEFHRYCKGLYANFMYPLVKKKIL